LAHMTIGLRHSGPNRRADEVLCGVLDVEPARPMPYGERSAQISRQTLLVRGERGFTSNLGLSTGTVCRRKNCLLLDVETPGVTCTT